jgi:hypothetical protein
MVWSAATMRCAAGMGAPAYLSAAAAGRAAASLCPDRICSEACRDQAIRDLRLGKRSSMRLPRQSNMLTADSDHCSTHLNYVARTAPNMGNTTLDQSDVSHGLRCS